jgi:hypothetical protein
MSDDSEAPTVPFEAIDPKDVGPQSLPVNREDKPELGWDVDGDGKQTGIETKVPEPAVLRGLIATAVGIVGLVLGKTFDLEWIDQAVAAYALAAPLALSFWVRMHVTPVKK